MKTYNIFVAFFISTVKGYSDPCRYYFTHGTPRYLFSDASDCTRYYECSYNRGQYGYMSINSVIKHCPQGKSFMQTWPNGQSIVAGGACIGPDPSKVLNCYTLRGQLSQWSQWTPCSVTCNEGTQTRTRQCLARGPAKYAYHLTFYCNGKLHESRDCYRFACQGNFGEWAQWGPCSATCGQGTRKRNRNCYGSIDCEKLGPLEQEEVCPYLPKCLGTLGEWSEWSACNVTCGYGGYQERTRECFGQYSCVGHKVEIQTCDIIPCKGRLSQWSRWSQCSSTCGKGTRHRTRTCIGLGDCYGLGPLREEYTCPNQPKCQGTLGQWSPWSSCSATCGEATRQRHRKCNGPGDCLGPLEDEKDCKDLPSCQGTLGLWSDWSECSSTCGKGTRQRQRECIGPGSCDGLGLLEEEEQCPYLQKCISEFEEWSEWEDCSATCGEGNRTRTRNCLGPHECVGNAREEEPCPDLPKCTSEFEEWSEWEHCSTTCGEGTRTRTRNCPGPYECVGSATQLERCPDNPKCPCTIKEEECQFATVAPVYYTQCKNDDTICSGGGGESDPCEGDSPDLEEMKFCTAKMAEISDLTDAQKPWVLCSEDCFVGSNPKNFTETTGCTAEVRECKFPFKFNDKEYTECTNDLLFISDYDDRTKESFKWCATSTNSDGSMKKGKWGRCDEATCDNVGA